MRIAMKIFAFAIVSVCNLQSGVLSLKPNGSYRSEDNKGNYAFGYSSQKGTSFHEESGSPGMKLGTYGVAEADGTQRVVKYIADENGFRATVEVKDQDPHHVISGYHTAPILMAQAQPANVLLTAPDPRPTTTTTTESVSNSSEKATRRIDEATPEMPPASAITDSAPNGPPPETATAARAAVQASVQSQLMPLQNLPAGVLLVPVPAQHTAAAYSRVHTYSVNGFVPVLPISPDKSSVSGYLPVQSGDPSVSSKMQQTHSQMPPSHPVLTTWQYIRPHVQPYVPLFI